MTKASLKIMNYCTKLHNIYNDLFC